MYVLQGLLGFALLAGLGWLLIGWKHGPFHEESTTPEDPRRDELEVESANASLVHELGNAEDTQRYAGAWSSEAAPESEQEPTPKPLSPWLDDSR